MRRWIRHLVLATPCNRGNPMQRHLVTSLAGPRTGAMATGEGMLPMWRRTSTASGASRLVLDTPWNSGYLMECPLVTSLTALGGRRGGRVRV
jgi:hypothetical protein